jgi:uncharacterized lipoprotein YddW (UPF0748 family)
LKLKIPAPVVRVFLLRLSDKSARVVLKPCFRQVTAPCFPQIARQTDRSITGDIMKTTTSLALLAVSLSLTSCINFGPSPARQQVAARSAPQTVEGTWADPNGIISTFQGGAFSTRTTDTNQVLASGTYTNTSPGLVEINMTSMVRKTQSKVNCALVNSAQLNCTSDSGAQFSLARRS